MTEPALSNLPRARLSLATFEDGAVLLNLETGGYFALNRSAEHICRILLEEDSREVIERRVALELRLSESIARAAVDDVMRQLSTPAAGLTFPGPFTYQPLEDCYQLCVGDVPILEVRRDGQSIRRLRTSEGTISLSHALRVVAPKLLSHRGLTVLHASACQTRTSLTAFCGLSGAGKTTTARAFAADGMTLFSEDLVILAPQSDAQPHAVVGAEDAAHTWAREAASRAEASGQIEIDCSDVPSVVLASRPTLPLARIIFIDSVRREGDAISLRPLKPSEAFAHLLMSNFLGSADSSGWESYFSRSAAIVRTVDMNIGVMPNGIERLPGAIKRYRESSAS